MCTEGRANGHWQDPIDHPDVNTHTHLTAVLSQVINLWFLQANGGIELICVFCTPLALLFILISAMVLPVSSPTSDQTKNKP